MPRWHLRGVVLPDERVRDVWVEGDRISLERLPDAHTIAADGYLVPGLVDAHCHPGTVEIGASLADAQLVADGTAHLRHGTSAVRVPGSASRLPSWFGQRVDLPRVTHAGLPVAAEGGFFPGWGRQVPPYRVAEVAAEEAAAAGWCKLIIDWFTDDGAGYGLTMSPEVVADATRAVHAIGGKVAVHTQSADGGRAAVSARVDSIEHGMHFPLDLVDDLAATGITLVPTASTFITMAGQMTSTDVPAAIRDWFSTGLRHHATLVREAYRAGATVLAGTDLPPGSLTSEIRWLAAAGLSPHDALGAGSWTARREIGLPTITHGAPADILVYDRDPRSDLTILDEPQRLVIRGRIITQP